MKKIISGLFTAFSLYSVIPVPRVEWSRDNMRFALCFFPIIGGVTGGLCVLWHSLAVRLGAEPALYGAVAALIPLIVSGGIHMDGFIDTADALSSHALMEKKLEILKDPHVGAFGVIFCAGYMLLSYGLWQQLYSRPGLIGLAAAGFVFSRCMSALSVALFPTAKSSGLLHLFAESSDKRAVIACAGSLAAAAVAAMLWLSPLWGAVCATASVIYFALHRRMCIWEFGGNTGDLAGFLLQNTELIILVVAAVGGMLT